MNGEPIRVLVVDDEPLARKRIVDLLDPLRYIALEAEDGVLALEKIRSFAPHIVFLDIQMPELSGFDVIGSLDSVEFSIIFQTAYDAYAIQAFEISACDYLLKPFTDERFYKALARGCEALGITTGNVGRLLNHLHAQGRHLSTITYKAGQTVQVVDVNRVIYFFSIDHTTNLVLEQRSYAIDHSLTLLEAHLDPKVFLRIHRNAIVNIKHIRSFSRGPPFSITLHDGRVLKVSRDRAKALGALFKIT